MSTLPPDPYKALGVTKDAKLPEIRSAHRKLVLKCHPDKVQDAALKAVKQDEFQKVQQAYELLSDDARRIQYDEQVKLFELRKEMSRGNPTARSNPFEYEIRTAEPRSNNSVPRSKPAQPSPKVYSAPQNRSWEDVGYEPRSVPRKTASYDSTDRKRASAREEERRKHDEDEKARLRFEKEHKRSHGEKKKSRDKERKRGSEEKHSRTTFVVDDDDSDDYRYSKSSEKKSSSRRMAEEMRQHEEAAAREREAARAHERTPPKSAPLDPKWNQHMDFAGQYMQAARRKVAVPEVEDFRPSPPRRAETFAAPSPGVNVRHVTPFSDEETPRRSSASSARKESRKSVDTPSRRDKSSKDRRSPPAQVRDPYIVEPPDPPVAPRKPTLQSHSSAPPNLSIPIREKPSRSRTQEYPRQEAAPSLPRAQTFQAGERSRERSGGSRLKKSVEYSSDSSDSDSPIRPTQRRSYSPQRRGTETRYVVESGHINHRSTLHHIDDEQVYTRDRSESPRGGRHSRERPPMPRAPSSHERPRAVPVRPGSQTYYTPDPPPIIREARPSMTSREPSYRGSSRGAPGAYFQEVKYAPKYGAENVIYSAQPADIYQKRSDQNRDPYYASYQRSGRGEGAVAY